MKLELEDIYRSYCNDNLEGCQNGSPDDKFIDMMFVFVEFRLDVSGGDKSGCMVSMKNVNNFLNEIHLYDNMMDDWSGGYRGDFNDENFDCLEGLVDNSNLNVRLKKEILEGYKNIIGGGLASQ